MFIKIRPDVSRSLSNNIISLGAYGSVSSSSEWCDSIIDLQILYIFISRIFCSNDTKYLYI